MDLQTLLLAMSIPSGVTAFCFWLIEEKMKRERQEREQKEAIRQQSEILLIKSVMAAIAPGRSSSHGTKERARKRRNRSRPGICPENQA